MSSLTGGPATKAERTRERILAAAATVIAERGVAGTRFSDVARAVEMAAPALYYHFATCDELIDEVMTVGARRCREGVEEVLAGLDADTTPLGRIRAAAEGHLRVVLESPAFAVAATRNMGQLPPDLRGHQLLEQERYGALWRQLLEDARAAGDLAPGLDPGLARMYVLGALNWVPEWWNPSSGPLDDVVGTMGAMTVAAVAAP